jgi:hypothetical protein
MTHRDSMTFILCQGLQLSLAPALSGDQSRAFPPGCQMAQHGRSHRPGTGGERHPQVPKHLA